MRKRQQGFTMIELLVAMGVTVVVLLGAVLAFRESVQVNSNVTQSSDINDNLRAGMNFMVQDVIQAGTGIPTGGIAIPNTQDAAGCNTSAPIKRPFRRIGTAPPITNMSGVTLLIGAKPDHTAWFACRLGTPKASAVSALRMATNTWLPSDPSAVSMARASPAESITVAPTR